MAYADRDACAANAAAITQTLVELGRSAGAAWPPHMLDVARRAAVQGVMWAHECHVESRMAAERAKPYNSEDVMGAFFTTAAAHAAAGDVFMQRHAYAHAAREYARTLAMLETYERCHAVQETLVAALLGFAEAVVRTDAMRAVHCAQRARRAIVPAQWHRYAARFTLLANKIMLWDGAQLWLDAEQVEALCAPM
jgi:hypothetical protein